MQVLAKLSCTPVTVALVFLGVVAVIPDIVRFENGKVVERWGVEDMSGFVSRA